MTKQQPFSGTFKLDKKTKNTVQYAEEAEGRRPVVGTISWINTNCRSRFRRGFGSPLSPLSERSAAEKKNRWWLARWTYSWRHHEKALWPFGIVHIRFGARARLGA